MSTSFGGHGTCLTIVIARKYEGMVKNDPTTVLMNKAAIENMWKLLFLVFKKKMYHHNANGLFSP